MKTKVFVAVKSGYYFALIHSDMLRGISIEPTNTVVEAHGKTYPLYRGTEYKDAKLVDEVIDNNGLSVFAISQ